MGLQLNIFAGVTGNYTGANAVAAVAAMLNVKSAEGLTTGAGAFQSDILYTQPVNLAASATETLDLVSGMIDPLGAACVFVRVKAIIIFADPTNVNDIVLGGAGANGFIGPFGSINDVAHCRPGGMIVLAADDAVAWLVNASTAHLVKVANSSSGTAVAGKLVIIGSAE